MEKLEKRKQASRHPERPGKKCRAEEGVYRPVIDRNLCEGKNDCVVVCPYDVFKVKKIEADDFEKLSFVGKVKSLAHGQRTAYTPHEDLCKACGLCVVSCPEKAIELRKFFPTT